MNNSISIILADDDEDDRLIFQEALAELPIPTKLTTASDGEQLMQLLLQKEEELPHVLYLDINMPLKNGFDCLAEIKNDEKLAILPVIIFSTCFDNEQVNQLYDQGANYYMRKPTSFPRLREILERSLHLMLTNGLAQPPKEKFILNLV